MTSFLPSGRMPSATSTGRRMAAGAGLAGEHDAVEHELAIGPFERTGMEAGDRRVEHLGDLAHRRGADALAEDRQQRLAHFPGREPEHERGQDHAVDLRLPPGIGAQHRTGAEAAGARHHELDRPERGQQTASVAAVAAIRLAKLGQPVEMTLDRHRLALLEELRQGRPRQRPAIVAKVRPSAGIAFTTSNRPTAKPIS